MAQVKKLILLIDDDSICNAINRIMLKKKFSAEGEAVDIVDFENPIEGLNFYTRILKDKAYERIIVLLDINMPLMTGWEFLEDYALLDKGETEVRIYILTSSVNQNDIDKANENPDVIQFISKPITTEDVEALFEMMEI